MSIISEVMEMLAERGEGSADDLAPLLPNRTHRQIAKALRRGREDGKLEIVRIRSRGIGHGRRPGIYRIAPEPGAPRPIVRRPILEGSRLRVASVWGYAQGVRV